MYNEWQLEKITEFKKIIYIYDKIIKGKEVGTSFLIALFPGFFIKIKIFKKMYLLIFFIIKKVILIYDLCLISINIFKMVSYMCT